MSKPVISVENLSKAYRIGVKDEIPDTLVGAMTGVLRAPFKNFNRLRKLDTFSGGSDNDSAEDTLWALKDVSFDVREGEVVGIIGRNGAGKSTLLKVLSRITEPTSGRVVIRGRVSSLLEVGTGFHPELTGRDNVYMNGTILGMTKREIDRKFDEIVDFSGVEKFLDTPVKRYSSGMQVRLAFAVAAHLEPEILIIDEVLAVGDAEFQKKCIGKMKDVAQGGRTVLFVSHNMAAIENLCNMAVVIRGGELGMIGKANEVIKYYLESSSIPGVEACLESIPRVPGLRSFLRSVQILNSNGNLASVVPAGDNIKIVVRYGEVPPHCESAFGVSFHDHIGTHVFTAHSRQQHGPVKMIKSDQVVMCEIPRLPLLPGQYRIGLVYIEDRIVVDRVEDVLSLEVAEADVFGTGKKLTNANGIVFVNANWTFSL